MLLWRVLKYQESECELRTSSTELCCDGLESRDELEPGFELSVFFAFAGIGCVGTSCVQLSVAIEEPMHCSLLSWLLQRCEVFMDVEDSQNNQGHLVQSGGRDKRGYISS
jgi:hypothetical protein